MNIFQSKWEEGYCRTEDGIFYPDIYIPITYIKDILHIGKQQPIQELYNKNPEMWCDIYSNPDCSFKSGGLSFFAGSSSWEGEGFVAVIESKTSTLRWIFHMSTSEKFVSLKVKEGTIIATSREYPHAYEWRIPVNKPENLSVKEIN